MSTCSVASTSSAARIPSGAAVRPIPGRSGQILRKRDAVEDRLGAGLGLAVVDAGAVQHQDGSTGPVLDVVDHHLAHSDLHPRKLDRVARGVVLQAAIRRPGDRDTARGGGRIAGIPGPRRRGGCGG